MVRTPEPISYLIEDPKFGDSLKPAITNKLVNDNVGDFDICAAETYDKSGECVVYIDRCSKETAHKIRSALKQAFVVLDEDFEAWDYDVPEKEKVTVETKKSEWKLSNRITDIEKDDSYKWN